MRRELLGAALLVFISGCGKDAATNNGQPNCGAETRCAVFDDTGGGDDVGSDASVDAGAEPDVASAPDQGTTPDMGADAGPSGCGRELAAADRARKVVVAHPFEGPGYELLDLAADGTLTRPGVTFSMGEGADGEIQFTPDGVLGFAAQDDGTLGVFRINESGMPEVLAAAFNPGFYVSGAIMDPSGDVLWAWETGFRENDAAIYRLDIDCASGMPSIGKTFAPAKLVRGAAFLDSATLAVSAVDLLDDETPNAAHLLDLSGPTRLASTAVFPDTDAIAAGFAVTHDGKYALIGDNSAFSGVPNRVGIVRIDGDALSAVDVIDVGDPVAIVTSPYDNAAIVLSTVEDEINVFTYDPANATTPFVLDGPLATTDATLLPVAAAMVRRGALDGLVLVSENVAVRRLRFEPSGAVTDLGILPMGDGIDQITGAIGVQP